ncbi:zeta toxin family protein [Caviibacterium pharyngocola]|uniref:Antitoxin/toxin system zeta toxin, signal recognition particle GTPase n=1 Tax=Caviibacterium pharyngocola TaxID=28159 RepID=A0A2M8RYF1_9PAST|nr:zeta toxin family protein [Caviibacterium pharyngocola]PJG83917.1 antitoxin/toxin system zeta toxin, signal recognition particle GTPase [Caviibacterium pharyngocola]
MAKDIKPTEQQIELLFTALSQEYHLFSVNKPVAIIVAGISGSGKSTCIANLLEKSRLNFCSIQADDYRKYHPKLKEFREKYGFDEAHKKTGNFAHRFATALLNKATEKRLNILYETTFGNVETATNLLDFLKEKQYEIHIIALPANIELSILRNQMRYEQKILAGNTLPRIVEKSVIERMTINYQQCIEQLAEDKTVQLYQISDHKQAQDILKQIHL